MFDLLKVNAIKYIASKDLIKFGGHLIVDSRLHWTHKANSIYRINLSFRTHGILNPYYNTRRII